MPPRRIYLPNSTVFITQVVSGRTPIFAQDDAVELLLTVLRTVKEKHPFRMVAWVILPDHLHLLIAPHMGIRFSSIMHSLKRNFALEHKRVLGVTGTIEVWQKGFWDHLIRDQEDLNRHLDYVHYNPVRHGYSHRPEEWRWSSYREWVVRGAYCEGWGWSLTDSIRVEWQAISRNDVD